MKKKSEDFSEAMRLARSEAGQELLAYLKNTDKDALQQAMNQAASGDYDAMKQTMQKLLTTPEAQRLLRELGG